MDTKKRYMIFETNIQLSFFYITILYVCDKYFLFWKYSYQMQANAREHI